MKLIRYHIRNFRRLENVEISLDEGQTIFVGPNNSGKTSATMAFRLFVSRDRDFSIYDYSSALINKIDSFSSQEQEELPPIEMDLWFSVDPNAEYGRVAHLLPNLAEEHLEVGLRLEFSVDDAKALLEAYEAVYPKPANTGDDKQSRKSLSFFLSEEANLKKYFSLKYYHLETVKNDDGQDVVKARRIEKSEDGKSTLNSLLRVDYVDAQRNIADLDGGRSNRLSSVLADFYKSNLEQKENDAAAVKVVDESNESLTQHYQDQFKPLIDVISGLGFPSANDRDLKILSTLSPEAVLKGNTTLRYVERGTEHELPEAYNGLGLKNLIFIAIQISHFQRQWVVTEKNRPLCQVIFIEEPEVHLHAQIQQAFIRQIQGTIEKIASQYNGGGLKPQLLITTHSSHILAEVDFTSVRYFRREASSLLEKIEDVKRTATKVLNLAKFQVAQGEDENLRFLKKYLKITHCDLFFADAAILVEGTVERLLFPEMIARTAPELKSAYMTILEVGGAYAHRFTPLLDFIGIATLVITDLDSVNPSANNASCRADTADAITSNNAIKDFVKVNKVSELLKLPKTKKEAVSGGQQRFIAYQTGISVDGYTPQKEMIPRTFEEAFIYTNLSAVREEKLSAFVQLADTPDFEMDYQAVYEAVSSSKYKKVEFALNQIESSHEWKVPLYIAEGLCWINDIVNPKPQTEKDKAAGGVS